MTAVPRQREAAPDPFPSSPASAPDVWLPPSAIRFRFAERMMIRERALGYDLDSLPRKVRKTARDRRSRQRPARACPQRRHGGSSAFKIAVHTGLSRASAAATGLGGSPPPIMISASVRAICGDSGARKGPAGISGVAEAAIAVDHDQRAILGDRGILEAVVHHDHAGALRFCQRDSPSIRSRATPPARRASINGSSPTSAASCRAGSTSNGPRNRPP